uniref:Uncharacterized protein n=1 Tax=Rhizophora mucronata TaxID=61149 RepID=A0A2P2P0V3_RHIMU
MITISNRHERGRLIPSYVFKSLCEITLQCLLEGRSTSMPSMVYEGMMLLQCRI